MKDVCIAPHAVDPDRPRQALPGLYLCHGHRTHLEQLIAELPARADDMRRPVGHGRRNDNTGLAIDEHVARHRSHMAAVLASWCRVVYEDRGITPPAGIELHHTAPWLIAHVEWLAAQPFVDEILAELKAITRRARSLSDIPARRVPLAERCVINRDGSRCEGTVALMVHGDDWWADCTHCEDAQDATPYLRGTGWVTLDGVIEMAKRFAVPCSPEVVRQWHHRRKIKGKAEGGRTWYGLASVYDYLAQRARKVAS